MALLALLMALVVEPPHCLVRVGLRALCLVYCAVQFALCTLPCALHDATMHKEQDTWHISQASRPNISKELELNLSAHASIQVQEILCMSEYECFYLISNTSTMH